MAWSSFQALIGLVDHGNVFGLFTIENGEVHGGLGSSGATRERLGWGHVVISVIHNLHNSAT